MSWGCPPCWDWGGDGGHPGTQLRSVSSALGYVGERGDTQPCPPHRSCHPPVLVWLKSHSTVLWAGQRGATSIILWRHISPDTHTHAHTHTNAFFSSPNTWSFPASSRSKAGAIKVPCPPLSVSTLLCHFFLLYHCVSSCWWSWPPCSSRRCIQALQHTHPSPGTLHR